MDRQRKKILIISEASDLHSTAVAWALRRKGHDCRCLYTPDVPTLAGLSMRVDPGDPSGRLTMRGPGLADDEPIDAEAPFDAVWQRRPGAAALPQTMHPGDRQVAERQCAMFLEGVAPFIDFGDGRTFWVNPVGSDVVAQQKAVQLRTAARVGLAIPPTLISNDPREIRAFLAEHGGRVAHKMLRPASWLAKEADGEHVYAAYTVPVEADDLPDDDVLRLCPGIFQPYLDKSFEVRIACLGDRLVAVRIESQTDPRAATDWRAGQIYVAMEPYEVPEDVADGCRSFLRRMGLPHASFDFVVGPDGRHTFLEINPQGQFLFLETRTGLPLLDMFSEFLLGGRRRFTWREDHEVVRFADFEAEWKATLRHDLARHARLIRPLGAPDDGDLEPANPS